MTNSELKGLVEGVARYFAELGAGELNIGVPYIKDGNQFIGEITGIIGLTGKRRGGIFITCSVAMVNDIIKNYLGIENSSPAEQKDMIGEIANTISGNASDAFGADFQISVPVVIRGKPQGVDLPTKIPTFVVPITWRNHKSYLVVGVE